jgi:hypothetical protein
LTRVGSGSGWASWPLRSRWPWYSSKPSPRSNDGINAARAAELAVTIAAAGALAVTMALHASIDYRWTAFGLGASLVGVLLAASLIHELTSEHVRHELELERPTALQAQPVEDTSPTRR